MRRILPEEEKLMVELYSKLGTYAAVARAIGRSPNAVSAHIKAYKKEPTITIKIKREA